MLCVHKPFIQLLIYNLQTKDRLRGVVLWILDTKHLHQMQPRNVPPIPPPPRHVIQDIFLGGGGGLVVEKQTLCTLHLFGNNMAEFIMKLM